LAKYLLFIQGIYPCGEIKMSKFTGPGRTEHRTSPKSLLLYNFNINGDQLKAEHEAFLRKEVVPILQRGGSISLVGLASRSGSDSHNLALSEKRAHNTLAFLRKVVPGKFAAREVTGFGESKAKQEGYRDGSEDERFRSVIVFVSPAPTPPDPPKKHDIAPEKPKQPFGPKDRTLVVLLENGGIEIDVPAILLKLKKLIPASAASLIPDTVIQQAGDYIKEQIKKKTDFLLESADLLLNRFTSAIPIHYGKVIILRDGTASYVDLKKALIDETRDHKTIDLFILTHGSDRWISVRGGIDIAKIQAIKAENGNNPLNLRIVYMMNCVGSSLNDAWLKRRGESIFGKHRE
jgi:hypothetical protein